MGRAVKITAAVAAIVLLAILPGWKKNYQPGALMAQHASVQNRCIACHKPWHGVRSAACVACHGNFADNNPHGIILIRAAVLMPGRTLASTAGRLRCLSCHAEHQGRVVDVRAKAAFACQDCHYHPSIAAVAAHAQPLARRKDKRHLLRGIFSHRAHDALISFETPPGSTACDTCHLVEPVAPGKPDKMAIKWSGCAGSDCHASPQEKGLQLPRSLGPSPRLIAFAEASRARHLNAVFNHSPDHLRFACVECHTNLAQSMNPDDANARAIKRCFSCHAHQPLQRPPTAMKDGSLIATAFAASTSSTRITECGQCHWFHIHGAAPTRDFGSPALAFPPHMKPPEVLTVAVPTLSRDVAGGWLVRVGVLQFSPWWVGWAAAGLLAIGFVGYLQVRPSMRGDEAAGEGLGPQHLAEFPVLDEIYQSNIPKLHIIGEAAGTASINLAMRSGGQVIDAIAARLKHERPPLAPAVYDVAIVGCGPAGLGAATSAKAAGLNYLALEKLTPASTIRLYPRAKFVQATPIEIAEYGSLFLEGDDSKEGLIAAWQEIIGRTGLQINEREELVEVKVEPDSFELKTTKGQRYQARYVVLAIGVRGNPRRLGLAGESAERVYYNLIEPGDFQQRKILVVGGGNAGAEVIQALAAPQLHNSVAYSYRDAVLTAVTRENAEKINLLQRSLAIVAYPSSALKAIEPGKVLLELSTSAAGAAAKRTIELENDVIFAMIGAELPTRFLKAIGVQMKKRA